MGPTQPLLSNFQLDCVMRGIKRVIGVTQSRKLPFTLILLQRFLHKLDLKSIPDSVLWGAILLAFFGLLRRSNVLCSPATFNPSTSLCRRDVVFYEWGIFVLIRHTKTIQHRESCLKIPLPSMPGYRLCPVQAIYHALHLTSLAPADGPAFVIPVKTFNTCIVCDTLTAVIASVW